MSEEGYLCSVLGNFCCFIQASVGGSSTLSADVV